MDEEDKNNPFYEPPEHFVTPKAPPRRRRANSLRSQQQSLIEGQDTLNVPSVRTLPTDDIESIQGDLSVNEALLTGDKRSICVDELSCEKTTVVDTTTKQFEYESRLEEEDESMVKKLERQATLTASCERVDGEEPSTHPLLITKQDSQETTTTATTTTTTSSNNTSPTTNEPLDQDQQQEQQNETTSVKPKVPPPIPPPPDQHMMIKNIDTGEMIPLDKMSDKCINPLNLHLLKITNDYPSDAEDTDAGTTSSVEGKDKDSVEEEEEGHEGSSSFLAKRAGKQMKTKLKGGLKKVGKVGRHVIQGAKQTVEVVRERHSRHKEQQQLQAAHPEHALSHAESLLSSHHQFRLKVNKKTPAYFDGLKVVQELHDCRGAVWCMKWSVEGQLLAVAGQDQLLRVYCSSKAWKYFTQLRNKASGQQTSPASTKDRSFSGSRSNSTSSCDNLSMEFSPNALNSRLWSEDNTLSEEGPLLLFSAYRGHTADVLDISWSKNHFILSSSMDKTVRLWHITRIECLCTLRHLDFVTTISFHPKDDRYFLSGSLDGKLRLWNIPDKRVTLWNEVSAGSSQPLSAGSHPSDRDTDCSGSHGLITASAFVQNGKFAVIGTYDGRVIFYSTDQLKYFTQLHVSNKGIISTALSGNPVDAIEGGGRGRRRRGRSNNKVTGIESVEDNKILVTTNDSRIRLYDLRDLSLVCKYKGCVNLSSQIRASVSHDNKYIVCGSENSSFYIWKLQEFTAIGQRRDKNNLWESVRILPAQVNPLNPPPPLPSGEGSQAGTAASSSSGAASQAASNAKPSNPGIITAATFAPSPKYLEDEATYVIAAADFTGCIRLFSK